MQIQHYHQFSSALIAALNQGESTGGKMVVCESKSGGGRSLWYDVRSLDDWNNSGSTLTVLPVMLVFPSGRLEKGFA